MRFWLFILFHHSKKKFCNTCLALLMRTKILCLFWYVMESFLCFLVSCYDLKIHRHDWNICQMTIFFTCVFIGRCTLPEKSTKSPPNHITCISQILGNKINIFTGRQSKTKNRSCFLLVRFDLELTSFYVHKKLWCSVKATCAIQNARFDAKVEGMHSFPERDCKG